MNIDDVYRLYLAIRLHFTSDYDIRRYKGAVKRTAPAPARITSALHRIAKKYPKKDDLIVFFVANQLRGDSSGGIFSPEGEDVYFAYKKRHTELRYEFRRDIDWLIEHTQTTVPTQWWSGVSPPLTHALLGNHITLETATILEKLYKYLSNITTNDPAWKEAEVLIHKYSPFLKIDRAAYRDILTAASVPLPIDHEPTQTNT